MKLQDQAERRHMGVVDTESSVSFSNETVVHPRWGTVSLGPQPTKLLGVLDEVFTGWAVEAGCTPMILTPLLPVAEMAELDLFVNFPHLVLLTSGLDDGETTARYSQIRTIESVPGADLQPSQFVLPSAACFAVYLHMQKQTLERAARITVLGRCFRREAAYEGLRRLQGFHMREAVCVGSLNETREHLEGLVERIAAFAAALDLPLQRATASDPFFDPKGSRALMQKLGPVKNEFLFGDLAIASVNLHRNFFGERCKIRLAHEEGYAFSSCVAFGLERWIAALSEHFRGDWSTIFAEVGRARDSVKADRVSKK